MRDAAVIMILLALIAAAFYRPWLGVLGLSVVGYMNPHKYASEWVASLPCYKIMFVAVALSTAKLVVVDRWRPTIPFRDWRLLLLLALWCYFAFTTSQAISQVAWPKFLEVSKILAPLVFTLVLIENRRQLTCLVVVVAACFTLLVLKGGFWALMTGFSDRVYGPPGSHYYDNNSFVVAVVMTIPLLLIWLRSGSDRTLQIVLWVMLFLSAAAALSSWSRGGVLALLATGFVLIWYSKRKYSALLIMLIGTLLSYQFLPDAWFERMETIAAYETEGSAVGRLATWRAGYRYAQDHPVTGAGFDGWKLVNHYGTQLDWHSAYIEILAEHGFIAFGIWITLLLGTVVSLERLARTSRPFPQLGWIPVYSHMLIASLTGYGVGALFLGISYWDILYQLIIIAVLVEKFAMKELREARSAQVMVSSG